MSVPQPVRRHRRLVGHAEEADGKRAAGDPHDRQVAEHTDRTRRQGERLVRPDDVDDQLGAAAVGELDDLLERRVAGHDGVLRTTLGRHLQRLLAAIDSDDRRRGEVSCPVLVVPPGAYLSAPEPPGVRTA